MRNSYLVLASSYSGKSYWAEHAYTSIGTPFSDGDQIIGAHKLWPKTPNWWEHMTDGDLEKLHVRHANCIADVLSRNKDLSLVFWTNVNLLVPIIRRRCPSVKILGVVIPDDVLKQRYDKREAAIKAGSSKDHKHGRPWNRVLKGSIRAAAQFSALRIVTYRSFDALSKANGIYTRAYHD
jgi:hypothetical protein